MKNRFKQDPIFRTLAVLFAVVLVAAAAHYVAHIPLSLLAFVGLFGAYTYGPQGQIMSSTEAQGRNTNSIMQGWVDRGPWQYWDTVVGAAGTVLATEYDPFSVPVGAQDPLTGTTKNKLATNMVRGHEFPPPRCLLLISIGFYFSSTMVKTDIDAFINNCWMEFKIDDKVFHEGHPILYPAGAGLYGVTTQSGESVYTNGLPSPCYTRRYDSWSKYIAPLQQFSMSIFFPGTPPTLSTTGAGLLLRIYLDGLTDRSVQ